MVKFEKKNNNNNPTLGFQSDVIQVKRQQRVRSEQHKFIKIFISILKLIGANLKMKPLDGQI